MDTLDENLQRISIRTNDQHTILSIKQIIFFENYVTE